MLDYDVFVIVDKLDSNYNYEIRLVTTRTLDNKQLLDKFDELNIKVDKEFTGSTTKIVYFTDLSCLVDIKKWLINLDNEFKLLGIRSNLDSFNKTKELKK